MITIHNLRNEKMVFPYDRGMDRQGIFGNQYNVRKDIPLDEALEEACDKYQQYFTDSERNNSFHPAFKEMLDKLYEDYKRYGKLRLFCWCAPKRCHSETIRDYLLTRSLLEEL